MMLMLLSFVLRQVEVLRTKIEVTMTKAQPNQLWSSLEKGAKGPLAAGVGTAVAAAAADQGAPRLYPSSKGPKDWSKVEGERVLWMVTVCT